MQIGNFIDWVELNIDELGEIKTGSTPPKSRPEYYGIDYPFYKPTDLNAGYNTRTSIDGLSELGIQKARFIPENAILITCIGATIGKVGIIRKAGACNQQINAIVPYEKLLNPNFVYFQTIAPKFQKEIKHNASATTLPILNKGKFEKLPFYICPIPEQRAIVAKIEQLFSDWDNGIVNLKKAQEQLKIYRQAVLKKAFVGELTRKWREEQTDLASAEELLQQIKEERERHYQKQLDEWKKTVKGWEDNGKDGKKPSRPKKPKELPPLSEGELKELPELPEVWCWVKLDVIGKLFCGQSPSTSEVNTEGYGTLYITGPEQWNGVKIKNDKWTEYPKRIVPDGCIFITAKGAGVGTLFPGVSCTIGRDIYAYRPLEIINFEFVINALRHGIDLVIMKAKGDIPGLSKNHILDHFIGLPSIEEQNQIICEIETRLSVCDKLEETIAEALQKSEALRQSILKKAFEGKLLSEKELEEARNAPDWEPADKLLERINVEKEKPGNKK